MLEPGASLDGAVLDVLGAFDVVVTKPVVDVVLGATDVVVTKPVVDVVLLSSTQPVGLLSDTMP